MKYLLKNQETERLQFRLLKASDFDAWQSLFEAINAALHLGLDPNLSPIELCKRWFKKCFSRYENDLGGLNVLVDKTTGKMIGQAGLLIQKIDEAPRLEVAYSILPEYWRMGYASEAAIKCRDYAFEQDFWPSLISIIHLENYGSERVAQNNGMRIIKPNYLYKSIPVNIYGIERAHWESLKGKG